MSPESPGRIRLVRPSLCVSTVGSEFPTFGRAGVDAGLGFDASNGLLAGGTGSGNSFLIGDIFTINPVSGTRSHMPATEAWSS
jgi:hypothetical protein